MDVRYVAINPECRQGKHRNCDGNAMCDQPLCDSIHSCQCTCHPINSRGGLMFEAQRCPDNEDGGHRLINQGRDESLDADRFQCSCGRWEIGNTDEHQETYT